ncbi:MAG TPA: hypothetical protein VGI10_10305 [Polyangiaceae bacterium]
MTRTLLVGLLMLDLLSLGAIACNKQTPSAAEEPRSPLTTSAPSVSAPSAASPAPAAAASNDAPAPAADGAAASKYSDASFDLSLSPKGAYSSGQAGEADIVLVAKAPYHVNDKYPYKFKLKEAPGLSFPNLVIAKDAVKLEAMKAEIPVAFTPQGAGKKVVAGQLSFSVCTVDKCQIEKRDLALDIDVK